MRKTGISTQELWAKLFRSPSIELFFNKHSGVELPAFSDYIERLANEKEAQAYFEEMYEMELSDEKLGAVAGGRPFAESLCAIHYYEDESAARDSVRRMQRR